MSGVIWRVRQNAGNWKAITLYRLYILRYIYNLELYLADNIWRDWKLHSIFATEKKVQSQRGVMTAHALLLATDNFFRQIVNFSEQSLVRKVAVAYFATIAERQIALPWRLRPYLAANISPGPREGWAKIRPRWVEHYCTTPTVCAWFRNRLSDLCKHNRCAGTCPTLTPMPVPMFKRDAFGGYWHTYIIHTIADKMVFRWWEFVQIWNPQKIFVSLCSNWEPRIPKTTRSTL